MALVHSFITRNDPKIRKKEDFNEMSGNTEMLGNTVIKSSLVDRTCKFNLALLLALRTFCKILGQPLPPHFRKSFHRILPKFTVLPQSSFPRIASFSDYNIIFERQIVLPNRQTLKRVYTFACNAKKWSVLPWVRLLISICTRFSIASSETSTSCILPITTFILL